MEKREKILVGVLGVVAVAAAAWFGMGMLKSGTDKPAASPQPTPIAAAPSTTPAVTPNQQAPEVLIEQALEITGTLKGVDRLQEQLSAKESLAAMNDKVGPEVGEAVTKALLDAFSPEAMRKRMREVFKADYNEAYLRAMIAAAGAPEMQKLIHLEAGSQPKPEDVMAFMRQIQSKPLPPARLQLLQRLDAAAGISHQTTEIALLTAKSMMQGMSAASGKSMTDVDAQIERSRAQMGEQMRGAIQISLAYLYRDVGDQDLANYAALYESPHGAWFMGKVYQALREELQAGSKRFGARLPELIAMAKHESAPSDAPQPTMAEGDAEVDAGAAHEEGAAPRPKSHARAHRRWEQDARECLDKGDNMRIIRCAETYY